MSILSVWFAVDFDPTHMLDLAAAVGAGCFFGLLLAVALARFMR